MITADPRLIRRVKRRDRIARLVITLGGMAVIGSVIAIVVLICGVTLQLFRGARAEVAARGPLPEELRGEQIAALGAELVELRKEAGGDLLTVYALTRDGTCSFFRAADHSHAAAKSAALSQAAGRDPRSLNSVNASGTGAAWELFEQTRIAPEQEGTEDGVMIVGVERSAGSRYTLLWSNGAVSLVEVMLEAEFDERGRRGVKPGVETLASFAADEGATPLRAVASVSEEGSTTCAMLLPGDRIAVRREQVTESLLGTQEKETTRLLIDQDVPGPIRAMTLDRHGSTLYAGSSDGVLARWLLSEDGHSYRYEPFSAFRDKRAITSVAMVFGDVSLAVGDSKGRLSTWSGIRMAGSEQRKLRPVHQLRRHDQPVVQILPSRRDKTLVSLGEGGAVHLDYVTSEKPLLTLSTRDRIVTTGYSPRGNAVAALDSAGELHVWKIDNPHPEVSWRTLFGKVHYDNHDQPKYIWQSSGTDEPKFSLVPVIFGTLKSTVYAMLFAVPLALFGAMYVSHFTTPGFKRAIKPVVEIMAAVPSVVVGFLVLLWLAPKFGDWIVAVFASFLTIPATFVAFMLLWQLVRRYDWAKWVENGYEFLVLAVFVILPGVTFAFLLADPLETVLFGGDFKQWLVDFTEKPYEQLNSIVVALGLGFAVIPIIFSISEDALSDIPHSLNAASLALGASRWQTVWRVVLPSASPAIFAAVMIGFGRAVGETMIVFMATGNTPILDWSPFNGFRTLSANIAVEISEAPRDGTLYRVLFLCAVLLFLLTFLLNTVAELVRQHLRKKFGRY
jgi:phosphate transport system permease protein